MLTLLNTDILSQIVKILLWLDWGSIPDYLAAAVAAWGLKIANDHFNKPPKIALSIHYDTYQKGNGMKHYRFWAVNDSNRNITIKWIGLRMASNRSATEDEYQYTYGDNVSWQFLEPGEASDPIEVNVVRITQIIHRWMDAGDTYYIDVAYLEAHNKIFERKGKDKIKVTLTMVDDNTGLPTAPNNGIPKFMHSWEIGVDSSDETVTNHREDPEQNKKP